MAVSERVKLILISRAGNLCSFKDCEQKLTSDPSEVEGPVMLGEVAHIVGQKPDGPRGKHPYPRTQVDDYDNLIYLCPTHHELIDKQEETYTVEKLRQMKADHEEWVAERLSRKRRFERLREPEETVVETVSSTILPVRQIPAYIFAAPCGLAEAEVKDRILPAERGMVLPYIIREKTLYTFIDLRKDHNPFSKSINPGAAGRYHAIDWWQDQDRMRWYTELLNRTLNKLTGRLGLNLDKEHKRYYFEPLNEQEIQDLQGMGAVQEVASGDGALDEDTLRDLARFRNITYKTLGGQRRSRQVAYRPAFKSGEYKKYWEHLAVSLRFHYLGGLSWVLSIRPERRFTRDGYQPLTPKGIGRRSTNRKSHMYNADVHGEVHFWKEYLSRRYPTDRPAPRIKLDFGSQALIIENKPVEVEIAWPGVPDDVREIRYVRQEDDLFSIAELEFSFENDEEDADEWGTDEEWENV